MGLAVSYNRPTLSQNASWCPNAITVLNSSQLIHNPPRIFVDNNNKWYIAFDDNTAILSGNGGSISPTTVATGGYGLFVSANHDVYTCDSGNDRIVRWSKNGTLNQSAMFITNYCRGLFISVNNTLYCSLTDMHQVMVKSLSDPANTLTIVAGTGCVGSATTMLSSPAGIFVDSNITLYVADTGNDRIQRFSAGQTNATIIAGNGAPSTITLLSPMDVVLDGDGYLFIADTNNHRIIGSGSDGFRCVAGCTNSSGSASNQLLNPWSLSFDNYGNIWVADFNNHRVQKFTLNSNSCGECSNVF